MAVSRLRNGRWHYQVRRKHLLAQPIYLSFDEKAQGDAYVAQLEALLDRGIVPKEFAIDRGSPKTIRIAIHDYRLHTAPPASDRPLLDVLTARLGAQPILGVDYDWAEKWVAQMKRVDHLAPGTIRHYVGALARCFDYLVTRKALVGNPLRSLPRRYAVYNDADRATLPKDVLAKRDIERDRRLGADEEQRIRVVLGQDKRETDHGRTLLRQAALEFLFTLALESAMRLREMYTLEFKQFDVPKCTVFLEKTKNGDKRQVPLTTVALQAFEEYSLRVRGQTRGMQGFTFKQKLLFPWWSGERSEDIMRRITWQLSRQFARIFRVAKVEDFRFHDLRHEATSRFFERTTLSDTAIAKITGHRSARSLARYANLRGSALASQLW
jgi:integrase